MSRAAKSSSARSRAARAFFVLVSLPVLAGAAYWTRKWAAHVAAVRAAEPYGSGADPRAAGLSAAQLLQLGWMHAPPHVPASSYVRRLARRAGARRVGLFGCSFVQGLETAEGFDPASLLERRLRALGLGDVEAVNFGNYGYGMHQSHLIWTYLAQRHGLDAAFFFPQDFHYRRDQTFAYEDEYAALHARYVLAGDGVELVPVLGRDRKDAMRRYHRLLTPRRYLRYDRRPPMAAKVLMPRGRTHGFNPFYYHPRPEAEIPETYVRLFSALARAGARPAVWTHSPELERAVGARLRGEQVPFEVSSAWTEADRAPELYRAPGGHLGPLGNDLQARELAAFIAGRDGAWAPVIELSPAPARGRPAAAPPLDRCDALSIGIGGRRLAALAGKTLDPRDQRPLTPLRSLSGRRAASLLVAPGVDGGLLAMAAPLEDGAALEAVLSSGGREFRVPLGRASAPGGLVGRIALSGREWSGAEGGREWSVRVDEGDWLRRLSVSGAPPTRLRRLELGGAALVENAGPGPRGLELRPVSGELLRVRALPDGWAEVEDLPSTGTVDLIAESGGRTVARLALYAYTIRRRPLARFGTPAARRPLARAEGRAR